MASVQEHDARPSFAERLRSPRLWIWAVVASVIFSAVRGLVDQTWPGLRGEAGWLGYELAMFGLALLVYAPLGALLRPFEPRR